MADKDLKSFKVGDTQKTKISNRPLDPAAARRAEDEALSTGFRRIEILLDEEDRDTVTHNLHSLRDKIDKISNSSKTNKEKSQAKKAIVAIDRTLELMEYLYQVKDSLVAQAPE